MRAQKAADQHADESGFVLIWFALLIIVLLGIAAVAVDLVHAYQEAQHAQAAADAAALGGAVEIPTDTSTLHLNATGRAVKIAQDGYGYAAGDVTANVDLSVPNQLDVTVHHQFNSFFGSILGFPQLSVTKHAFAQYDPPAQMGSAVNHLGDVPACPTDPNLAPATDGQCTTDTTPGGFIQYLWASVQGPETDKQNGNAITNTTCSAPISPIVVDGCAGAGGSNSANTEYNSADPSEKFEVRIPTNGAYTIWVYDPSMVNTNPVCGESDGAWASVPSVSSHYGGTPANAPYCTGDTYVLQSANANPMMTNYQVFDPADATGARAADACTGSSGVTFPGFTDASNTSRDPAPVTSSDSTGPDAAYAYDQASPPVKTYFHQWYPLCSLAANATVDGNEYEVRVKSLSGQGTNQFAILVTTNAGLPISGSEVFSRESLPLTALSPLNTASTFYVARVLPSSNTRTLQLSFFDLGDSSTSPDTTRTGTLSLQLYNASGSISCTYTPAPSSTAIQRPSPTQERWPITSPTPDHTTDFNATGPQNNGCGLIPYDSSPNAPATWNGRWIAVQVTIPSTYSCNVTAFDSCWIQLQYKPSAGVLSDATTWDAQMLGAPVRLVG